VQPLRLVQVLKPSRLIDRSRTANRSQSVKALTNVVDVTQTHEKDLGGRIILRVLDSAAPSPISDADDVGASVDDENLLKLAVWGTT